jgi:hypothetical protein
MPQPRQVTYHVQLNDNGALRMSMGYGGTHRYTPQHPKGWNVTPKWHWRYWVGHTMRKWDTDTIVSWRYRTFKQHARLVLEEACNEDRDRPYYRSAYGGVVRGRPPKT